MSEESNTSEGFVIEGNIDVAVKGHLALYSIVGGRIGYLPYATRAQELGLSERYVPAPRKAQDAFARAKDVLHNMSVPTLDTLEGWDGPVARKIVVKPLKKGSEYAVSIEHSGRSRGRRHKAMQNLFRISFDPPNGINPDQIIDQFRRSCWDEEVDAPDLETLRQCVTTSTYWEDQVIEDPLLLARLQGQVLTEFINIITSIDSIMLRNDIRKTLMSLGGLPFKSGAGAWFIPKYSDEDEHLTTLENYANLLTHFGNHNALSGSKRQENWFGENGAPRKWYRQKTNLRVMGYIDNERQLQYIKDDIQNALSLEIAEYQEKLLNIANDFNKDKISSFNKKLEALQVERADLQGRLNNLSALVGGVNISTEAFSDVSSQFEGRLATIGHQDPVSNRLRDLMSLSE